MKVLSILICLLLFSFKADHTKKFEVELDKCYGGDYHKIVYIDIDNDAIFDSLKIFDCGYTFTESLDSTQTVGTPDLDIYRGNVRFNPRLINYNLEREDAYFQVQLIYQDKVVGYWEHIMGSYTLHWRD